MHRWQSKAEEIEENAKKWEQQARDANESLRIQTTQAGKAAPTARALLPARARWPAHSSAPP